MEKVEKLGSAKRFGSRYGSKPKHKFAKIEKEQRRKHLCPYCSHLKVKRLSVGIWHCKKCNSKFTGKAYTVSKAISFEKAPEEEKIQEKEVEKVEETETEKTLEKTEEVA
jgi:large subunit ribosomal protein L37Ae